MRSSLALTSLLFAVGLAALTACGSDSNVDSLFAGGTPPTGSGSGGSGGQGGMGGQGGAAQSSSSSAAQSSSSSSSSTAGQGGAGGFNQQACAQCAGGACQNEIFACGQACIGFVTCVQGCTDKACADGCLAANPQAQPVYDCTCAACGASDCGAICGGGSSSNSSSSSSGAGGAGGGMPACTKCSQILQGTTDPPPCTGSAQLAGALFQCTCQQSCSTECSASCSGGGQPTTACFTCVQSKCGTQLQACLQD